MKLVEVLDHKVVNLGLLQHTATVIVEGFNFDNSNELVELVSIQVGYHPLGHGIYGSHSITKNRQENEYTVTWSTGTHSN